MAKYHALIEWEASSTDDVSGGKYGRGHRWTFDENAECSGFVVETCGAAAMVGRGGGRSRRGAGRLCIQLPHADLSLSGRKVGICSPILSRSRRSARWRRAMTGASRSRASTFRPRGGGEGKGTRGRPDKEVIGQGPDLADP
ncbi:Peroxiredoxin [Aphelenchoides bicaudatus]|nr:Peroxiredoxin [Aphelenchoides bicaudatus]